MLIKKSQPGAFSIKVRPCCLLPFTTPGDLTKNKLLVIRMMILQFPIAHGLIYVFYNIRWIEDPAGSNLYFLPFMLASIIAVVWGLNLLTSVVAPVLPDHGIQGKYLVLQLVLLMCKLQPAIGDLIYLAEGVQSIPVEAPMTVSVYKNGKDGWLIRLDCFLKHLFPSSDYLHNHFDPNDCPVCVCATMLSNAKER